VTPQQWERVLDQGARNAHNAAREADKTFHAPLASLVLEGLASALIRMRDEATKIARETE